MQVIVQLLTIVYLKSAVKKLIDYDFADPEELQMLQSFLPRRASKEEIAEFLNTLDTNNKGEIMRA